jgi:hypothetical protein
MDACRQRPSPDLALRAAAYAEHSRPIRCGKEEKYVPTLIDTLSDPKLLQPHFPSPDWDA